MKPVYITGYGITCAIGDTKSEVLDGLKSGHSGISTISGISNTNKQYLGGQVQSTNESLLEKCGHDRSLSSGSRTTVLSISAIQDLISGVNFFADARSAFLNASSVGGMDTSEVEFLKPSGQNFNQYKYHTIGSSTDILCDTFGWNIYRDSISTACSSAANAIMLAGRMISAGQCDQVIAGGSDALSLFTIRGFDALMIYDEKLCTPFDKDRKGLNLGEGAAEVEGSSRVVPGT